jgi:ADP-heptose:LPS heptosyltransferase
MVHPPSGMKILVISLAGIGDTILATPLIRELRASFPDAQIDALVLWAGSKDALQGNPHLTTVHQKNFIKTSKTEAIRFLWPLRQARYDVSINTHPQSRTAYRAIARLVGANLRLSHLYECSGALDRLMVNRTLPQNYQRHSVDNNLDLLTLLGKRPVLGEHQLELFLSQAEETWADELLKAHSLAGRRTLGIHVGSGGTKNLMLKRWPLEHYIALLRKMNRELPGASVLLFGGPEEEAELRQILALPDIPHAIRVPSKDLRQAAALMKRCTGFLSVDTALMHVAAAVRAPRQLVIEAPTFNKTNEPFGNPFRLIRNPAVAGRNLDYYRYDGAGIRGSNEELRRCMMSVSVEAVFEAVVEALL